MTEFNNITHHSMSNSINLQKHGIKRVNFNPKDAAHLRSMKTFIESGNWGKVQFLPEFPYNDVPTTILMKFATYSLKANTATRMNRLILGPNDAKTAN